MALDSALVMKLTDSLVRFESRLETQNKLIEESVELQREQKELLEILVATVGDDDGDDQDEDDDVDEGDEDEEDEEVFDGLPDFLPEDIKAEISKRRKDPDFLVGMLGVVRNFINGGSRSNGSSKANGAKTAPPAPKG